MKILYVGDNFTYTSLKNIFDVHNVNRREVKSIDVNGFSFLFIESFWHGKDKSWYFRKPFNQKYLRLLIEKCKSKNIPVIFYNKEDPFHFDKYLGTAKMADIILTIEEDCVDKYKLHCPNAKVIFKSFFVNEKIFNCFQQNNCEEKFFFSGTYYKNGHDHRRDTFEQFIDVIAENEELEIIDRNFGLRSRNVFPQKYKKFIKTGNLSSEELCKYVNDFKYSVNINTVVDSKTFFARRVVEHIALGKIVVSNYAKSFENFEHGGLVFSLSNDIESIISEAKKVDNNKSDQIARSMSVLSEYGSVAFSDFLIDLLELESKVFSNYTVISGDVDSKLQMEIRILNHIFPDSEVTLRKGGIHIIINSNSDKKITINY